MLKEMLVPGKSVSFSPTQGHIPFSDFDIGDTIKLDIDWFVYKFTKNLRVLGVNVYLDQNGVEFFSYDVEEPKD